MFTQKKNGTGAGQISLIGKGTRIEGNISFSESLRVDGEIVGRVEGDASGRCTLVLSEHGRIEGEVSVAHLVVNGTISGPVRVTEFLEMQPKARITGDVQYAMIEIQQGAVVEGHLVRMGREPNQDKAD